MHCKDHSSQQGNDLKLIMSDRTVKLSSVHFSEESKNEEGDIEDLDHIDAINNDNSAVDIDEKVY